MSRITFETPKGKLIDIVDSRNEAVHAVFILKDSLPFIHSRLKELGVVKVDKNIYKLLRQEGYIKRRE